jgi:large subunit ribosomal protein L21e
MIKGKTPKSRGKLKLSQYFQEFKNGDRVAVVREHSLNPDLPIRTQGISGEIIGQRGNCYIVRLLEGNEYKIHIIKPMHLKKISQK